VRVSKLKTHHRDDNVTDKFPNINWVDDVKFASALLTLIFLFDFLRPAVAAESRSATPRLRYAVIAQYPHDTADFTQGLALLNQRLFESTGQYGRSALIEKELRSGKTLRRIAMDPHYFGEGIAVLKNRIYQLTWLNGIGLIYDPELRHQGGFQYEGEGWGLTSNGEQLILSDGSSRLRFLDPASGAITAHIEVRDQGRPVADLNELEYARQHVWANLWHSDRIAVIRPRSGQVAAWLDLSNLRDRFDKPVGWDAREHVLNGIAYDSRRDRFLVTGKCWPALFELSVERLSN